MEGPAAPQLVLSYSYDLYPGAAFLISRCTSRAGMEMSLLRSNFATSGCALAAHYGSRPLLPRTLKAPRLDAHSSSRRPFHSTTHVHQPEPSTSQQDPYLLTRQLADELRLPLFSASGKQLHLLRDPSHFYETLKTKISQAKERIFLASLYIGKEETELVTYLESALQRNPALQLTILVDALRGTREAHPTPSCASLVSKFHARYPDRVKIRLYHTPNLKGWLKKIVGKRFNEGWGLQHMKIYGFDDDVVLSGANLSRDYFTNRRDRYLLVERHREVADYLCSLVHAVGRFSFKLESIPVQGRSAEGASPDWKLIWDGGKDCPALLAGQASLEPYAEPGWTSAATKSLEEFTRQWHHRSSSSDSKTNSGEKSADTLLLPLLQMGPLHIRQETHAIPKVLSLGLEAPDAQGQPPNLGLTSGYFSLYKPYKALLLRAKAARTAIVKIICAAPEANGFFQSKGVSGWIPEAYTWYEYQFWKALQRSRRLLGQDGRDVNQGGVEIREWNKDGWTYHAKGIWYTPPSSELADESAPTMMHVGSSNYGSRSADLDLECTFLISTKSKELSQRFREEFETLQRNATDVVDEKLFQRPERQVRRRVKMAAWILKGML
ncbi:related to PGS1-phosphatidylglycerophosphate synthase [Ustilago bromivora]|uniref:CDP-diacylglycerol--glycerol-3-phosphate 3-phosphatidyltransferase n=1 Tax=Ustilago bromivora TaxID=307758 RepID=A0A1K0GL42_9BASI|nr:related to PGS1-phosphatidylglycerophosphate synthase [Ustilago bromivora]